MSNNSRL